ncbi:MAG: alpha/beta hydrolase [Pyrinomonadaceae bacterium]
MLSLRSPFVIFIMLLCFSAGYAQHVSSVNAIEKGNGKETVILLAGLGTSSEVWNETMNSLSDNNKVYAISFSGFAGNTAQADPSIELWEKDILKFIKDKHIKNPILVGHSLGGTLALKIAADHPGIVSKLVIVDALPSPSAINKPDFKRNSNLDCTPSIKQFEGMNENEFYSFQKNLVSQMVTDSKDREAVLGWFAKSDRMTFGKIYCELLNTDLRKSIAAIKSPTLVMFQPLFKSKKSEVKAQYSSLKNSDIRFAGKGLHFIMYDDTEWFLDNLRSFLSE